MKTISVLLIAFTALAAPLCAQQPAATQGAAQKTSGSGASAAKKAAPASHTAGQALLHPALLKAKAPDSFKVRFTTTKGDFVVEVHRDWSPLGADRFYNLVKNGFFTDAAFFRVVQGFVVQFGLHANPAINGAWKEANIQDDPVTQTNAKGSLTFATAGPNTRTTQLFIEIWARNNRLDGMGFSPFGNVIEGMDVVEQLYAGYGEAPDQGQITGVGKPYLDQNFPLLDKIKLAKIEGVAPAQAAKKPATAKPAAKPAAAPAKQ